MSGNKKVKNKLIEIYGEECWIDKLHLRTDKKERKYKSKKEYKRMKQLTYHHIREKSKGGKATVENGALLSTENHIWFNKQTQEDQNRINNIFKQYKECEVIFVEELKTKIEVEPVIFNFEKDKKKNEYNRAKEKEKTRNISKNYLGEYR